MSADTEAEVEPSRHDPPLAVLDIVRDREDDDASDAVVVNTPPITAEEWVVYRHEGVVTVADDNPEYDPEDSIIVVAFRDHLREARPRFAKTNDALRLAEAGDVDTYAFPEGRLRRVATIDPLEPHDSAKTGAEGETGSHASPHAPSTKDDEERAVLGEDMAALRDRLDDSGDVRVEEDGDEAVLVVPKLGEDHTVYPDGSVSDGPLADRIADLAAEYLGGGSE